MVSFSVGVLTKIVVPDMYEALSIHKIRQNTKMPTFYKTLYLATLMPVLSRAITISFPTCWLISISSLFTRLFIVL
jgi:hypothetical protein